MSVKNSGPVPSHVSEKLGDCPQVRSPIRSAVRICSISKRLEISCFVSATQRSGANLDLSTVEIGHQVRTTNCSKEKRFASNYKLTRSHCFASPTSVAKPLKNATPLLNKTDTIALGASHKAPVIYPRYMQFLALKTRGLSLQKLGDCPRVR